MLNYLIRKTRLYQYSIIVFLFFLPFVIYSAWIHKINTTAILFFLQFASIFFLMTRAVSKAGQTLKQEWMSLLDDDVDPQALLDRYQSNPKLSKLADVQGNSALCYYLIGDVSRAIMMQQELISKETNIQNLIVYWLNMCSYYEANQEMDMSRNALEEAKRLINRQKQVNHSRGFLKTIEGVVKGKEMLILYKDHVISYEEYETYLKERLMKEKLVKRARVQIRYTLACLYLEHHELDKAKEEITYVDALGRKTYFYHDIHLRLKKLEAMLNVEESAGDL